LMEAGLDALSKLPHTQQIELVDSFNYMKTQFADFLNQFHNTGRVVTAEDIKNFFDELKNKKRRQDLGLNW